VSVILKTQPTQQKCMDIFFVSSSVMTHTLDLFVLHISIL